MQEVYSEHLIQKQETFSGGALEKTYTMPWSQNQSDKFNQSTSATDFVVIREKPRTDLNSDAYFIVKFNNPKESQGPHEKTPRSTFLSESVFNTGLTSHPHSKNCFTRTIDNNLTGDLHASVKNQLKLIIVKSKETHDEISDILISLYNVAMDSTSPADLEVLYRKLGNFIETKRYGACDQLLEKLDVTRTPVLILIGILRRLFSIRTRLEKWESSVNTIQNELNGRGLNSESMLKGIIA